MEAKASNTIPIRLDMLGAQGEVVHTSEFVKEKIVLGRILSADVRIDDPRVSRIHALIEVRGETVLVTDLASSHGTFVNGEKVLECKLKFGDVIRLGFCELRVAKGSGQVTANQNSFEGRPVFEGEATQLEIDRSLIDKMDRRTPSDDRRKHDAFPDEKRLEDRRQGDRRIDQRQGDRRGPGSPPPINEPAASAAAGTPPAVPGAPPPMPPPGERRAGADRRTSLGFEKRVGERRRGDRRVFDITSLERRIEDRRARKSDDDLLPEELEKAFEAPNHARELEVTALWGDHILDVSNFHDPIVLTVGESPQNEYIIPSEGIPDEFPLVTIEEDGTAYLAFTEGMTGTVRARDKIYSIEQLKQEKFIKKFADYFVVALKQDDFAKISIGTVNFFLLYVRPAPRIKPSPIFERDPLMMRTVIGSVLLLVLLFTLVSLVPKPKPVTIEMMPEQYRTIVIKKRPNIPKAAIVAKGEKAQDGGSKMGEGGAPKGPEGEVGKPEAPKKPEKAQAVAPKSAPKEKTPPKVAKAPPKVPPAPQRKVVDEKKAKSVGLLKAFSQSGLQKDLKNLIDAGQGDPGKGGFDDFGKAVNGLRGKGIEESGGAGGKGLKGVDAGGSGKTIGIDGPATEGLGRGYHGDGIGEGISGPGRLGIKGEHAISIAAENVQVLSGLPKDVINAVVQRHRAEIRACYDAALQRNPNLRGKVVMFFSIQPNGIVSSAGVKESTLGDGGIENCITSRVRTWIFPKPEAPVVTEVSAFPFYLNPAN
jgi:hypothetical protein